MYVVLRVINLFNFSNNSLAIKGINNKTGLGLRRLVVPKLVCCQTYLLTTLPVQLQMSI